MGRDNLDNPGQLLNGAPPERAAGGKRMGKRVDRRRNGRFPRIGKNAARFTAIGKRFVQVGG